MATGKYGEVRLSFCDIVFLLTIIDGGFPHYETPTTEPYGISYLPSNSLNGLELETYAIPFITNQLVDYDFILLFLFLL